MVKQGILPHIKITAFVILVLAGILTGCKQDMAKINAIMETLDLPDLSGKDIELHYSENGKLKRIFKTPEMQRFDQTKDKYYISFPAGVEVFLYNDSLKLESTIVAGYAEYHSDTKIWEARKNVVAKRITTNEQLNTEKMFWNEEKKIIFSDVFTKIINEDGIFIGENGFEADENLEYYILKGASGTVNVKNEDEDEQRD